MEQKQFLVDGEPIDYSGLPESHRETIRLYTEHGYDPGSGISAILRNDLRACVMVDEATFQQIRQIYRWVYNHMPPEAWGSAEKVCKWRDGVRKMRQEEQRNAQVAEPLRGIVNSIGGR